MSEGSITLKTLGIGPEYCLGICDGNQAAVSFAHAPSDPARLALFGRFPILWFPDFPAAMEYLGQKMQSLEDEAVIEEGQLMQQQATLLRALQNGLPKFAPNDDAQMRNACAEKIAATREGDRLTNLLVALELFQQVEPFFKPYIFEAASRNMNEAIVRQRLAERGVDAPNNLKIRMNLYKTAYAGFGSSAVDQARCSLNEGNARIILAQFSDPRQNLEWACHLFKKASAVFPAKSQEMGRCQMSEGVARRLLASFEVDQSSNLQMAARLAREARASFPPRSWDFASSLLNESVALMDLASSGIGWRENLSEAISLLQHAAGIFPAGRDVGSCRLNEAIARCELAKKEARPVENFSAAIALCVAARKFFNSDSTSNARSLAHEAMARVGLAANNIDIRQNLEIAASLYKNEIHTRLGGRQNLEIMKSWANLGLLYLKQNCNKEAKNAYTDAIKMLEAVRLTAYRTQDRRWLMET